MSEDRLVDIHNHLFPPVDDGPADIEESISSIRELIRYGFEEIVFTPHIHPSHQEEMMKNLDDFVKKFSPRLKELPVKIHLSCEYLLEPGLFRVIEEEKVVTLSSSSRFFLVEMWVPFVDEALKIFIQKCRAKNYFPVIAHPERNQPLERIKKMKEFGYRIQMNIGSLCGLYGPEVRRNANEILKHQLVDCIGTDSHDYGFTMVLKKYMEKIRTDLGEKTFLRLMKEAPAEIIAG